MVGAAKLWCLLRLEYGLLVQISFHQLSVCNDVLHCLNLTVLGLILYVRLAWKVEICQYLPSEGWD